MVQRLARGPFKAEIRVRFPLALPSPGTSLLDPDWNQFHGESTIKVETLEETDMANPFRTSNPALSEKAFQGQIAVGEAMTLQGTVNKTGLLLLCVIATSAWTWGLSHSPNPEDAVPWMM